MKSEEEESEESDASEKEGEAAWMFRLKTIVINSVIWNFKISPKPKIQICDQYF